MRCRVCKCRDAGTEPICDYCDIAIFQIGEILNSYRSGSKFPNWITKAVREFDFLYRRSPRTRAFFNAALEVAEMAIFGITEFYWQDLQEIRYTRVPEEDILRILRKAWIIKEKDNRLQIGNLVRRFRTYRMLDYPLNSEEMKLAIQEMHGVLATAITHALVTDVRMVSEKYLPRGAFSIFNLLSAHLLEHIDDDKIPRKIVGRVQRKGFRIVPVRQFRHIKYYMCGFYDGSTRILDDVDDHGNIMLKPFMVDYIERIRERYRERIRER